MAIAKRKTTTSTEVKNRWKAANYKRVIVEIPKKDGERFKQKCERENVTQASILKDAIYKFLGD